MAYSRLWLITSMWNKLIAVTDSTTCPRSLEAQLEKICTCEHKPQAIILRAKKLTPSEYETLAIAALKICNAHGVPLILHSHWRLALKLGVSALHLPLAILRQPEFQKNKTGFTHISTSIHQQPEIKEAVALGATVLIAGHIYTTQCKEGLAPRGLTFLSEVCQEVEGFGLPVYAIGGIKFNPTQLEEIKKAGATGACIMSGYMQI